jgi:hypothetical protein
MKEGEDPDHREQASHAALHDRVQPFQAVVEIVERAY